MTIQRMNTIVVGVTVLIGVMVTPLHAQDIQPSIVKILDFVNDAETELTVETLDRLPIPFGEEISNGQGAMKRMETIDSGVDKIGSVQADAIHFRTVAEASGAPFGMAAYRTLQVPESGYTQFQGGAEVLEGLGEQTDVMVRIETRATPQSPWVLANTSTGRKRRREDLDSRAFVVDLTPWAGREIRLSIGVEAKPKVLTVGGAQQVIPDAISANWYLAEVVNSTFRVVLGKPEAAETPSTTTKVKQLGTQETNLTPSAIDPVPDLVSELIMEGSGVTAELLNPSDASLASIFVPAGGGKPARFINYFTSRLAPPLDPTHQEFATAQEYGASTRVVEFDSFNNMFSSTPSVIQNSIVKDGNGNALNIIQPSGDPSRDFDDHYTGVTSAVAGTLNDGNPVIHAFVHAEDHFQLDGTTGQDHNVVTAYIRIGYARSIAGQQANFGVDFVKTSPLGSLPIITYKYEEDHPFYPDFDDNDKTDDDIIAKRSAGTASPSIFEFEMDGYYYMIFTTYSLVITAQGIPDPMRSQIAMFSAARALKSDVNNPNFSAAANPWFKFKEVNPNQWNDPANWTEPGIGGDFSGLWNAQLDENDNRTDQRATNQWRAFHKVSRNSYLNQLVTICKGGASNETVGIFIHTSANPVDWNDGMYVMVPDSEETDTMESPEIIQFPTLIKPGGKDTETAQNNKMFFHVNEDVPGEGPKGLWRMNLTFQMAQ